MPTVAINRFPSKLMSLSVLLSPKHPLTCWEIAPHRFVLIFRSHTPFVFTSLYFSPVLIPFRSLLFCSPFCFSLPFCLPLCLWQLLLLLCVCSLRLIWAWIHLAAIRCLSTDPAQSSSKGGTHLNSIIHNTESNSTYGVVMCFNAVNCEQTNSWSLTSISMCGKK